MTSFFSNQKSNIFINKIDFDERKIIDQNVSENEELLYIMLYSIKNTHIVNKKYSQILQHIIEYDNVYFKYTVHKFDYQKLPLLFKIPYLEYNLFEEITEKKEKFYTSSKKLKIDYMKGFEPKTVYFKIVFEYDNDDISQRVNLKYLPNNNDKKIKVN